MEMEFHSILLLTPLALGGDPVMFSTQKLETKCVFFSHMIYASEKAQSQCAYL